MLHDLRKIGFETKGLSCYMAERERERERELMGYSQHFFKYGCSRSRNFRRCVNEEFEYFLYKY